MNSRGEVMISKSEKVSNTAKEIVITIVSLPLFYMIPLVVMQKAHEKHWLFSIAVTLIFGCAIFLGLKDLKSFEGRKFSFFKGMRIFFLLVLLTAIAFASLSFLLDRFGWAYYASEFPSTLYSFNAYYIGVFFDLLPGIEVRETLGWTLPVKPEGFVAGLPVVVFRTLVIFGLLGSLKIWWSGWSQ